MATLESDPTSVQLRDGLRHAPHQPGSRRRQDVQAERRELRLASRHPRADRSSAQSSSTSAGSLGYDGVRRSSSGRRRIRSRATSFSKYRPHLVAASALSTMVVGWFRNSRKLRRHPPPRSRSTPLAPGSRARETRRHGYCLCPRQSDSYAIDFTQITTHILERRQRALQGSTKATSGLHALEPDNRQSLTYSSFRRLVDLRWRLRRDRHLPRHHVTEREPEQPELGSTSSQASSGRLTRSNSVQITGRTSTSCIKMPGRTPRFYKQPEWWFVVTDLDGSIVTLLNSRVWMLSSHTTWGCLLV